MKITKEIFVSFLACPYKAYLLLKGETGNKSEYEVLFKEIKGKYCADGLKKFSVKHISAEMIRDTNLKDKNGVIYQARIGQQDVHSDSCIMERVKGGSELGTFHYIPDLPSSPFDEEYKKMAKDFSLLLRRIIITVDEHGLKKRKLSKHKKDVSRFLRDLSCQDYKSELAQKYQKRFQKNENTLFTFLNYDSVPWNNNNAEHAIKHFAVYRQTMKLTGRFTERGLKQYLILLSIHQTCRYKGINFLKFLVSG